MKYLIAAAIVFTILFFARSRRVIEELEARLTSRDPRFPEWRGKCERKVYANRHRFALEVQAPGAPDGERVGVRVNDTAVGEVRIRKGHGRLEISGPDEDHVPTVREGDSLLVQRAGVTVLEGTFHVD